MKRQITERDIDYAWRAYEFLRKSFSYEWVPENYSIRLSDICRNTKQSCDPLSRLFVGILRSQRVPARTINCRAAVSAPLSKDPGGGRHTKCEFYAKSIGWVPIDISTAVSDKQAPAIKHFGYDDGGCITLNIDPDFQLRFDKDISNVRGFIDSFVWWFGSGSPSSMQDQPSSWKVMATPLK